ncbi:phosphoribosylformylglycinamidine synthase subunit PurL [Liquorilactobacillus vini]|uniref:Phosphoribosylformylglycinamidine synthase subunit PurL n=2 Tax=Liquorilactobacillus vini TaxID=238015 RepID=A0A0R2CD80_9LACO|nr:phosphoribosylformylglycinamidine synthase subunit PurL [Liquorilactobacillus vini]KRM89742.1 phosphoribosylformylglycinamidine synthase II [Liquorilactobacillus vini DSM 20605]
MVTEMTPEEIKIKKPYLNWGLSEKEYNYICQKLLKRLPNYTETGLFAVMWSEHCSYKMSKALLRKFPSQGVRVLQGPGEGAGILDIGDNQAVVFKAESHNHPSAVEPYQGAATGVGGIIRDIFSMGARPIALLDSLHFGEINRPRIKYLINEVVAGIGDYGNCMGIPTVGGEITFDSCYAGNPLVNAMCVGLMDQNDMQKGRAQGIGNAVIYVGAKTGRDGIHGATFASADFADERETQRSAVQVGDPFMEKLLMEACLELTHQHQDWLVGIQDMGAAGLVSSSCEMASKAQSGMELQLDLVPQREPNMSAYEIMLSESQERMLLCVKTGFEEEVKQLFKDYGLEAVVIGRVTSGHQYILWQHGQKVTDIPVSSLTEDVLEEQVPEKQPQRIQTAQEPITWLAQFDVEHVFYQMLQQPTIASKKMFTQTYDSQVRTNTVVGPGSDAAVLRIRRTKKGLAMTTDGNGRLVYLDPEVGGKLAVLEAAANLVASGAEPLGITDCLNYGDPHDPEIYWELHHSIKGMAAACRALKIPVISGNVSLYNENNHQAIYPTPMVGMVGLIQNLQPRATIALKNAGDQVYLIGTTKDDYAGSELQKLLTGSISGKLQDFDLASVTALLKKMLTAVQRGLTNSVHDLSEGGLAVAAAESAFATQFGLRLEVDLSDQQLFSETPGRFLVTVPAEKTAGFTDLLGSNAQLVGQVTAQKTLELKTLTGCYQLDLLQAEKLWEEAIPCLMKSKD